MKRPLFPGEKEEFFAVLNGLRFDKWEREYCDPHVLDSVCWELTLSFDDGRESETWSGLNAFPPGFGKLLRLFDLKR